MVGNVIMIVGNDDDGIMIILLRVVEVLKTLI